MLLFGGIYNILVEGRGHLSLWELAPVVRLGAAEVSFLLGRVLTGHQWVNCLAGLVSILLLGVEDLLDSFRQFLLLTQLLVNLTPGRTLEKLLGETQLRLLRAALVRVFCDGGRLVRGSILIQGFLLLALLAGLASDLLGAGNIVVDLGVGVNKDTLFSGCTALLHDSVETEVSLLAVFLGEGAASDLAEVVLHLLSLFLLLLALYLLLLVVLEHDLNLVLVEEGDRLEKDIQVHLDHLWLPHELEVGGLLLALNCIRVFAEARVAVKVDF